MALERERERESDRKKDRDRETDTHTETEKEIESVCGSYQSWRRRGRECTCGAHQNETEKKCRWRLPEMKESEREGRGNK